jgi:hypothetical protein
MLLPVNDFFIRFKIFHLHQKNMKFSEIYKQKRNNIENTFLYSTGVRRSTRLIPVLSF